jgi:hypothetical protein
MATAKVYEQHASTYTANLARVYEQYATTYTSVLARVYEQFASSEIPSGLQARVYEQYIKTDAAHHMILLDDGAWHQATLFRATATDWL